MERTTISINQDSQIIRYQPRSLHGMVCGLQHICSIGLSCLVSVGEDAPNSVETLLGRVKYAERG